MGERSTRGLSPPLHKLSPVHATRQVGFCQGGAGGGIRGVGGQAGHVGVLDLGREMVGWGGEGW